MSEQRWVFVVKVLDKPGALSAAASVFSNRGVSLEGVLGSGIAATTVEDARLIFSFRAVERKKDLLLRALQRLAKVVHIDVYPYSDPNLRAIAIAKVSSLDSLELSAETLRSETIAQTSEGLTVLFTGSTAAVETVIETLRQHHALLDVVGSAIAV
jgi:acetolactate synthase small subunit